MAQHRRLVRAGVLAVAAALLMAGLPANAAPKPLPAGSGKNIVGHDSASGAIITLITGDRALVSRGKDGKTTATLLPHAAEKASRPAGFTTRTWNGDVYLYPDSVIPALKAGRLDEELFNVSGLLAARYDDATRKTIPLIATYANGIAPRTATPGTTTKLALSSVKGAAIEASKDNAADFWTAFAKGGQITKLYLDKPVKGHLDRSVAQIGAPQAWAQGFDGTGAKVAVLDTGYDPNHPDLKDVLVQAENFTDEADAFDGAGHGTHVASTVLGNGAASGGARKGVAPGAKLLSGRVLDSSGSGQESWIIAGMEWAVAQGADVINMSLGGPADPGCDDAMGVAAEKLATQSLFVISAGNSYFREMIGSPGCAEGVLTVGAVDRDLKTANFSSRGPVVGDHRLKPEISAPGVGIVAAAMGSAGDIAYQAMSGTSMAAPHVAGSAAILAARHPDWTAQQLRAALVSAVRPNATVSVYEQGAGVVDVPRAIKQEVFGPASADLGSFAYPQRSQGAVTRDLIYTNLGATDVTLNLQLSDVLGNDGARVPAGLVRLETQRITVPAKGTATAKITVNPRVWVSDRAHGELGGRVVATGANDVNVTTPFGFWFEQEMVNLTVKVLDRSGKPAIGSSFLDVTSIDDAWNARTYLDGQSEIKMRVPAGTYSLASMVSTLDAGVIDPYGPARSITFAGRPEAMISRDTTVVLDARQGAKHRLFGADRPLEITSGVVSYGRTWDRYGLSASMSGNEYVDEYYAVPTLPVLRGTFTLDTLMRAAAPALSLSVGGQQLGTELVYNGARLDGVGSGSLVDLGTGTVEEISARLDRAVGKVALVRAVESWDITAILTAANAKGVLAIVFDQDVPGRIRAGALFGVRSDVPGILVTRETGNDLRARLAAGPVKLDWTAKAVSSYLYNLAFTSERMVLPILWHNVSDRTLAAVEEQWYAQRKKGFFFETMEAIRPYGNAFFPMIERLEAPLKRTAYFTPEVTWRQSAMSAFPFGETMADKPRVYQAGQRSAVSWYKQPIPTGITVLEDGNEGHLAERQANLMGAAFPYYRDAFGHSAIYGNFGDGGNADLVINGVSQGGWGFPFGQWIVPAEAADYELNVVTEKFNAGSFFAPNWRMSTACLTSFKFRSAKPASNDTVAVLPLVLPFYDMQLDEYNLAPALADFKIGITGRGQQDYDAGRIVSAKMWIATDEYGENWSAVPVVASGSGYIATVDNTSAAGGYVSIRVELTDEHGASVTQTVIKAYGVK